MLVYHANARIDCSAWLALWDFDTFDENAAFIGHIMTEEDVHQRGLASAIFAEESEDFAAFKL